MTNVFNRLSWALLAGAMALAPGLVAAAEPPPTITPTQKKPGNTGAGISELAATIIGWLLIIAGAVAVIFLIIGGIRYMVSSGNSDQIEKAKHTILYSIIGIIVVVLSYFIVRLISGVATNVPGS